MNSTSYKRDNCVSILVCLLAAILVLGLQLHKNLVYRLALYQAFAALAFSLTQMLQIIMVDYKSNPEIYGSICIAIVFFVLYCLWMKLLFTIVGDLSSLLFCGTPQEPEEA